VPESSTFQLAADIAVNFVKKKSNSLNEYIAVKKCYQNALTEKCLCAERSPT